jgi:sugar (pentulose or hexulose) kinase
MGTLIGSDAECIPGTFRTPSAVSGFDTIEVGLAAGGVMAGRLGGPQSDVCLPPVAGVMCVPYFAGSLLNPAATGRFVGLDATVDVDQLYAAWLESLVLELAFSSARLGSIEGPVGVCGGGATAQFSQWLSTALQVDVADYSGLECGLFGAALLALQCVEAPTAHLPPLTYRLVRPSNDARWRARLTRYSRLVGQTTPT